MALARERHGRAAAAACARAEALLRAGRAIGAVATAAAPDGSRALEVLSPPDRPVPPALWAALAAREQALLWEPAAGGKRPRALDAAEGPDRCVRACPLAPRSAPPRAGRAEEKKKKEARE